jgi:hypothetical protein
MAWSSPSISPAKSARVWRESFDLMRLHFSRRSGRALTTVWTALKAMLMKKGLFLSGSRRYRRRCAPGIGRS